MAKTRRARKQKQSRKRLTRLRRRKQRGGSSIPVTLKVTGHFTRKNVNFTESMTPTNLLERFFDPEMKQKFNAPLYNATGMPLFRLSAPQLSKYQQPIRYLPNWKKEGLIYDGQIYNLEYMGEMPTKEREKELPEHEKLYSFPYYVGAPPEEKSRIEEAHMPLLKKVLDHYKDGAKIIISSSATNGGDQWHSLNVNQQFKFQEKPSTPILLIDPAFFEPDRYDFYKYVDFKESTLPDIDPSRVKVYTKAKGPFEVSKLQSANIPLKQKTNYLEELNKQATEYGYDPEKEELEICCIRVPVNDNTLSKEGPFYDLLKKNNYKGKFKGFDYGGSPIVFD